MFAWCVCCIPPRAVQCRTWRLVRNSGRHLCVGLLLRAARGCGGAPSGRHLGTAGASLRFAVARKLTTSKHIFPWTTPLGPSPGVAGLRCSALLGPAGASCWTSARHQPGRCRDGGRGGHTSQKAIGLRMFLFFVRPSCCAISGPACIRNAIALADERFERLLRSLLLLCVLVCLFPWRFVRQAPVSPHASLRVSSLPISLGPSLKGRT